MKLEFKHLAGYLPWRLKIYDGEYSRVVTFSYATYSTIDIGVGKLFRPNYDFRMGLPILRPLSDLAKEIEVNGEKFVPIDKILREIGFNYTLECRNQDKSWILNDGYRALGEMPHNKIQKLYEWHFDIHGLIEKGLAIDINTLK